MDPNALTASQARRLAFVLGWGGFAVGLWIVIATWWNAWSWLGAAVMSLSLPLAAALAGHFFPDAGMRPAMRRYTVRLAAIMTVYFLLLMGATALYKRGATEGALGYLIAVVPALPILGVFALLARVLKEETDELMRQTFLTGLVWSGALTLCEATVWGFLETFRKAPHVWMWVAPVVFFAQLGLTLPLAQRKYR